MLKYELATSLTLNIEKMQLIFEWTTRSLVSQGIPLYLKTRKSFQDQRTRVFVSRFSNDNEEFK